MDKLIDETFFWGELKIAGIRPITNTTAQGTAGENKLEELLQKEEEQYFL